MTSPASTPKFNASAPKYPQNTFQGRLRHFLNVIDPRTLFPKFFFGMSLPEAQDLLTKFKENKVPTNITDEDLWKAKKIKEAIVHPDTGEKIFMPFRMSGFVPFGTPIVVGLLLPNQTIASTIFWQGLNQSHNALVNYSNRNASQSGSSTRLFVEGYIGAVSTAVGIAVGLSVILKKAQNLPPSTRNLIQRFVPFPAVATANVCNVIIMRRSELTTGIDVKDKDGNVVGVSKIAAKKALFETAITRMVLPAPTLLIPSIVMAFVDKTTFMAKFPRLRLPIQAIICTLSFGLALPIAISVFPQEGSIKASELEKELQDKEFDTLYYNKGL